MNNALDTPADGRYSTAISLCEAKRYGHNLGGVSQKETPGRFPHQQINEYLRDAIDTSLNKPFFNWAILTNGREWRLYYRFAQSHSYFSFNLEQGVLKRDHFKYFWNLFNANSFIQDNEGLCILDRIVHEAINHTASLEYDLRGRVYKLLERLANGFYGRKKNAISSDEMQEVYKTSLIYLYRLLFILYAEDLDLLPISQLRVGASRIYREDYSLSRLKSFLRKVKREDDAIVRLYNEIEELFTLIDGNDEELNKRLNVPRYNGGLFDPNVTPGLTKWKVGNYTLAEVLKGLMYSPLPAREEETLSVNYNEAIDYSDLEVRQLGSIYEELLEHHLAETSKGKLKLEHDSGPRKESGSYYTPDYIVKYIIRSTVQPLLDQIESVDEVIQAKELGLTNNSFADRVLKLKVIDPAMGSGHFLVRATEILAEEIALHPTTMLAVKSAKRGLSHEFAEIAYWRRRVVESCIYGVDLNPLAVELAKLSLWLTCISSTEPLSFLDHHIKCGNSLIGSSVDELDQLKRAGESTESLIIVSGLNEVRTEAMRYLEIIRNQPSDNLDAIKEKQDLWDREVLQRVMPFTKVADLRTAFDLGYAMQDNEYVQAVENLMKNSTELSKEVSEIKEKLNFFHWELAFPEVFPPGSDGGFDAVIGNPPYVRQEGLGEIKSYLADKYQTFAGTADLYTYFIERSLNLLRDKGRFGFIVSKQWMRAKYGEPLRKFVKQYQIETLADFGELKVFKHSSTFPLIMIMRKSPPSGMPKYAPLKKLVNDADELEKTIQKIGYPLEEKSLDPKGFSLLRPDAQKILDKMREAGTPLDQVVENRMYRGVLTGFNEAFIIDRNKRDELIKADSASEEIIVPFVKGDDVRKYHINFRDRYLILSKKGIDIDDYPIVFEHLKKYQTQLENRWDKGEQWWELRSCSYYDEFLKPKIVWPDIAKETRFAFDKNSIFVVNTAYIMPCEDLSLLGILNSRTLWHYLRNSTSILGDPDKGGRLRLIYTYMHGIPIPTISKVEKSKVSKLVKDALKLYENLASAFSLKQKNDLVDRITEVEHEIDETVYKLFGLTKNEIEIVGGGVDYECK